MGCLVEHCWGVHWRMLGMGAMVMVETLAGMEETLVGMEGISAEVILVEIRSSSKCDGEEGAQPIVMCRHFLDVFFFK